MSQEFRWARQSIHQGVGYEVSSKGDKRFSALSAIMPDGRTLEMWYQCDAKRYEVGGVNWTQGKGKPPMTMAYAITRETLWELYLSFWRIWAIHNEDLVFELAVQVRRHGGLLTDRFASSNINQARALAQVLNEWFPLLPRSLNLFDFGNEP